MMPVKAFLVFVAAAIIPTALTVTAGCNNGAASGAVSCRFSEPTVIAQTTDYAQANLTGLVATDTHGIFWATLPPNVQPSYLGAIFRWTEDAGASKFYSAHGERFAQTGIGPNGFYFPDGYFVSWDGTDALGSYQQPAGYSGDAFVCADDSSVFATINPSPPSAYASDPPGYVVVNRPVLPEPSRFWGPDTVIGSATQGHAGSCALDSANIYFVVASDSNPGPYGIWTMPRTGGTPVALATNVATGFQSAADNMFVVQGHVCWIDEANTTPPMFTIYCLPTAGGAPTAVANYPATTPAWYPTSLAADNTFLYVADIQAIPNTLGNLGRVRRIDPTGATSPKTLWTTSDPTHYVTYVAATKDAVYAATNSACGAGSTSQCPQSSGPDSIVGLCGNP